MTIALSLRRPEVDVNGQWVGYGLGDVSTRVLEMKLYLLKMFASYAGPLQASVNAGGTAAQTYDQSMVDVVTEMQTRYLADPETIQNSELAVTGIMNYAWQVRCGFVVPPPITIITWQGTGVSMWDAASPQPYGAALYVQSACTPGSVFIQPVGNYPAAIWPMGASSQDGVNEAAKLLTGAEPSPTSASGPLVLFGYSQGAICTSHLWRDHILNQAGDCHHRLDDVIGVATFGNPQRTPGVANGNADTRFCDWGMPGTRDGEMTGGISGPDCLYPEQTSSWWYDYVWLGSDGGKTELYTNAPVGQTPWTSIPDVAKDELAIYNMVVASGFDGTLEGLIALVESAIAQFINPFEFLVGLCEAIYNGLLFLANGSSADHYDYDWQPAIEYLTAVCQKWTDTYVRSGGTQTTKGA